MPPDEEAFREAEAACARASRENVIRIDRGTGGQPGRPLREGRNMPGVVVGVRIEPELAEELARSDIDKVAFVEHAIVALRKLRAGAPDAIIVAELARCLDIRVRSVV